MRQRVLDSPGTPAPRDLCCLRINLVAPRPEGETIFAFIQRI
jgi:hypothetical protein